MAKSNITFQISPLQEASMGGFLYRQLFITPPAVPASQVNLKGKTAIVTGSNIGLGFECTKQLLDLGLSRIILAVRNEVKGQAAATELSKTYTEATIEVWHMDLASYDSVQSFAERTKTLDRIDMVVLNAGVFKTSLELNAVTQHEQVLQVNYLSTALLAILMLPILKSKNSPPHPGRMVLVNSETAAWPKFSERNAIPLLPAFDRPEAFDVQDRYYTSKLLGQLFLCELAKRVDASKAAVVVNAVNPGLCHGSGLHHEMHSTITGHIFSAFKRLIGRSITVGSRTLTDAAVRHGDEVHGQYLGDCELKPMAPIVYTPQGRRIAQTLWHETMAELAFARAEDIVSDCNK